MTDTTEHRAEAEFRALIVDGLLAENVRPHPAELFAAAAPADDRSDAALRRIIQSRVREAGTSDFVEGSLQRQAHSLRDLKQRLVKERQAGDRIAELDRRVADGAGSILSKLDRRAGLPRRS